LEINSKLRVLAAFAADQDQKIILSPSNPSLQYAAPQTLALLAAFLLRYGYGGTRAVKHLFHPKSSLISLLFSLTISS
jgi:hypothetical protein